MKHDLMRAGPMRRNWLRELVSLITGRPIVALVCHDGDTKVRLVWRDALNRPCATFLGFGIREVVLNPDGSLINGGYVDCWHPVRGHPFGDA